MAIKSWNEMRKLDIKNYVKTRNNVPYLPWANCLYLLYANGAEKVRFFPITNENGSSLFMSEQTFSNKDSGTNRCYEVRVAVIIDGERYEISYPVLNGINPVRDSGMNQNAVHKAQMRGFVKCVAVNTGLGFDLWMDDADIDDIADDLSKHNIRAIQERMQIKYSNLIKKGMSEAEIGYRLGCDPNYIKNELLNGAFDRIASFEKGLSSL